MSFQNAHARSSYLKTKLEHSLSLCSTLQTNWFEGATQFSWFAPRFICTHRHANWLDRPLSNIFGVSMLLSLSSLLYFCSCISSEWDRTCDREKRHSQLGFDRVWWKIFFVVGKNILQILCSNYPVFGRYKEFILNWHSRGVQM